MRPGVGGLALGFRGAQSAPATEISRSLIISVVFGGQIP
jgi:hypothetical protein